MTIRIETPRGRVVRTENGTVEIEWNPNFTNVYRRRFNNAQKVIDSEVVRVCEPYIPLITGTLIKTGILGTQYGSGLVQWIAPYAKKIYYSPRPVGRDTGPLRGHRWFDRAMVDHKQDIVRKAGAQFGGRIY